MASINSLISDLELDKSLIDCLKNRDLDQKFFYTEEGADLYYSSYEHSAKLVPVDFSLPKYSVGAILFNFFFLFNKKVVIKARNEVIHFLSDKRLNLLNIRAYYPDTLNNFLKEHGFQLVQSKVDQNIKHGFFIYQRV
ncbi:hypothetical protein KBI31_00145 [Patescibacteria group bacterium]|nr:hypothetical protein [Patescibacteria group bacterium]HPD07791.1 hypothetical protein [bacterium]HRT11117.1 hypothetical protein [Patescibacteria group bacterium]